MVKFASLRNIYVLLLNKYDMSIFMSDFIIKSYKVKNFIKKTHNKLNRMWNKGSGVLLHSRESQEYTNRNLDRI